MLDLRAQSCREATPVSVAVTWCERASMVDMVPWPGRQRITYEVPRVGMTLLSSPCLIVDTPRPRPRERKPKFVSPKLFGTPSLGASDVTRLPFPHPVVKLRDGRYDSASHCSILGWCKALGKPNLCLPDRFGPTMVLLPQPPAILPEVKSMGKFKLTILPRAAQRLCPI